MDVSYEHRFRLGYNLGFKKANHQNFKSDGSYTWNGKIMLNYFWKLTWKIKIHKPVFSLTQRFLFWFFFLEFLSLYVLLCCHQFIRWFISCLPRAQYILFDLWWLFIIIIIRVYSIYTICLTFLGREWFFFCKIYDCSRRKESSSIATVYELWVIPLCILHTWCRVNYILRVIALLITFENSNTIYHYVIY